MKIILTGCAGFIGSNLASYLLNAGHKVVGFDNLSNPSIKPFDRIKYNSGDNWKNFKFFQVDIRDLTSMKSMAANEYPDMIIHLAALGSVPRSFQDPANVMDVNVKGFVNVMMLANILEVKRVVYASSSSVYGTHPSKVRAEEQMLYPISPYALSKKMNEDFARVWCGAVNMDYVGLRFFNVYGEGQLVNSPYSAVIPRFINGEKITIFGDGETVRDFTYVQDVCEAISLGLTTEKSRSVYNVGTGEETSLNRLAELTKGDKTVEHVTERPADIKESIANTRRAESLLGFTHKVSIEEGIKRTAQYYESLRNLEQTTAQL